MHKLIKDTNLKLQRFPLIPNDRFLAWDSADEYIINNVNTNHDMYNNVLIIEDEFGAIGLEIKANNIYFVNDSILSRKGIINNFKINKIAISNISFLSPFEQFPPNIDLIIIKIPKVNHYFEFLLNKLNTLYSEIIPLVTGTMLKYLNTSIYNLFKNYFSEFMYSLTWKKAKIITGNLSGISANLTFEIPIKEFDLTLINYPNLFSSKSLDIGTRFVLENLASIDFPDNFENIIDVGSANGILGLKLLPYARDAKLWLTDISFSAYESAKATIHENNLDSEHINLIIDNSLDAFSPDFAELIVINPPFHQNHKVTISIALNIFDDCYKVLKKQGKLLVVANKHLGYQTHLAKIFSTVELIKQNGKFVILLAEK